MKNLVTVLLIATLAIASSVAAQETPQVNLAVDVPAPAAPSEETIVDAADASTNEALWNNDKHHHHKFNKFKQCKPVIIALPIPESESECKKKCEVGCDDACEAGEKKCNATCVPAATCKANCRSVADCKLDCTDTTEECSTGCGVGCFASCVVTGLPAPPGTGSIIGPCHGTCNQPTLAKCVSHCKDKLVPKPATPPETLDAFCNRICGLVEPDCSETCTVIDTNCQTTCETCHTACETACEVSEEACKDACAAGGHECKIFTDVAACKEHCKPCEDVCENACYADQRDCEAQCKNYIGSAQECWGRCKRDCPAVCDRFCARCNAESLAANAPELPATDATVSEQLQTIAPAPAAV